MDGRTAPFRRRPTAPQLIPQKKPAGRHTRRGSRRYHWHMTTCTISAEGQAALDSLVAEAKVWADYRATLIFEELPDDSSRGDFIALLREALPALPFERAVRAANRVIRGRAAKVVGPYY